MKNKSKEQRYVRGIERNLFNANKYRKEKYQNMIFCVAKQALGIKKTDPIYDEQIKKLIMKGIK